MIPFQNLSGLPAIWTAQYITVYVNFSSIGKLQKTKRDNLIKLKRVCWKMAYNLNKTINYLQSIIIFWIFTKRHKVLVT